MPRIAGTSPNTGSIGLPAKLSSVSAAPIATYIGCMQAIWCVAAQTVFELDWSLLGSDVG
jgi:hypothetical protein